MSAVWRGVPRGRIGDEERGGLAVDVEDRGRAAGGERADTAMSGEQFPPPLGLIVPPTSPSAREGDAPARASASRRWGAQGLRPQAARAQFASQQWAGYPPQVCGELLPRPAAFMAAARTRRRRFPLAIRPATSGTAHSSPRSPSHRGAKRQTQSPPRRTEARRPFPWIAAA